MAAQADDSPTTDGARHRRAGSRRRQSARPGNAVPRISGPDEDPRQRAAAHVERRRAHVLPAGQLLYQRLRRRLSRRQHIAPDRRDVPMTNPRLTIAAPDGSVRAVALVLHGGRAKSEAPVRRTNLTVVRMTPFATSLRQAGADLGLAVARLRYVVRGWNG